MVENHIPRNELDMSYEATPLTNGAAFDLHKAAPNRLSLDDARKLSATANIAMQERREQTEYERTNSRYAWLMQVGSVLETLRQKEQGIGENITQDELRATFNKPHMRQDAPTHNDYDLAS